MARNIIIIITFNIVSTSGYFFVSVGFMDEEKLGMLEFSRFLTIKAF